jgi:hypothetical protein
VRADLVVVQAPGFAFDARVVQAEEVVGVQELGLLGPLTGRPGLQSMGGAGYGLVFPVACLLMALVLRRSLQEQPESLASRDARPCISPPA